MSWKNQDILSYFFSKGLLAPGTILFYEQIVSELSELGEDAELEENHKDTDDETMESDRKRRLELLAILRQLEEKQAFDKVGGSNEQYFYCSTCGEYVLA